MKQRTAKSRFSRALKRTRAWCRAHRHWPVAEQHRMLVKKLRGHYGYYGITGNWRALSRFRYEVTRVWRKWLSRRSQRGGLSWEGYLCILKRYPLPPAVAMHSTYRYAANP